MTKQTTVQQLRHELQNQICSGQLTGKIPSIAELTKQYGISDATVKKVLDQLKMQSYLYGQKGKGIFVNDEAIRGISASVLAYMSLERFANPFYLNLMAKLRDIFAKKRIKFDLTADFLQIEPEKYDTILIIECVLDPEALALLRKRIPSERLIMINNVEDGMACIGTDNCAGGYMGMKYLYSRGHRKIGVLTKDIELNHDLFHDRFQGVKDFVAEHLEIEPTYVNIISQGAMDANIERGVEDLLNKAPDISAVFAFTDIIALGVIAYFHRHNILIPSDISLLGFDNRDFASILNPPLTTIQEDADAIAENIFATIVDMANGKKSQADTRQIKPTLIVRESVRECKKTD